MTYTSAGSTNGSNVSKKRHLDRKNKQVHCSSEKKVKFLTLEDYLEDSPEVVNIQSQCSTNAGDQVQVVHKGYQKIPPTSPDVTAGFYTPRISFSSDKIGLLGRVEKSEDGSSGSSISGRSENGRAKKRVSFKLPDESDIIVFYPAEETFEDFR